MNLSQVPGKLYRLLLTGAAFLGRVNTIILLTVVFIIVFTPMGIFMRLLGKNLFRPSSADSFWIEHQGSGDLEKPY